MERPSDASGPGGPLGPPRRGRWIRRIVLASGLAALLVAGVAGVVGRGWIRERWCLFRLEWKGGDPDWPLVVELYERKCAAVTPYLLRRYRIHDVRRINNPLGISTGNDAWLQRVRTLVGLAPACVLYLAGDFKLSVPGRLFVLDVLRELRIGALPALPEIVEVLDESADSGEEGPIIEDCLGTILAMGEPAIPAFCRISGRLLEGARKRNDFDEPSIVHVLLAIQELPEGRATPLLEDILELERWVRTGPGIDDTRMLRFCIVLTLARLGPAAREAIPALEEDLKDELMRPWAALALCCIEPQHGEAPQVLVEALSHYEPWRWMGLVDQMVKSTPPIPGLFPHLARGLEDAGDLSNARTICTVMRDIDRAGTRNALWKLFESDSAGKRSTALTLLLEEPGESGALAPRLRALSEDPSSEVALTAATALARGGATDDDALRIYRERLGSDAQDGGREFAEALGTLARSSTQAREILAPALAAGSGTGKLALEAARWMDSGEADVFRAPAP